MDDSPPIYRRLLNVGRDAEKRTITLILGVDERFGTQIDISASLAGSLKAAIAAEAHALNEGVPADQQVAATLNATHVFLSQDAAGNPMIVFELANGTPLPLVMRSGDLAGLAAEMALLAAPKGTTN